MDWNSRISTGNCRITQFPASLTRSRATSVRGATDTRPFGLVNDSESSSDIIRLDDACHRIEALVWPRQHAFKSSILEYRILRVKNAEKSCCGRNRHRDHAVSRIAPQDTATETGIESVATGPGASSGAFPPKWAGAGFGWPGTPPLASLEPALRIGRYILGCTAVCSFLLFRPLLYRGLFLRS